MVISEESDRERQYITRYSKDIAGLYTNENWKMIQCATTEELGEVVRGCVQADIVCADITMRGALEMVKELRRIVPAAYIILIASTNISPLLYMRPTISAESLMLKPLDEKQIHEVLSEAIKTYADRFYKPDEEEVFVVENSGGRSLIAYSRILFFEARDKRVYLNTEAEEYGFYDTLDRLEKKMKDGFLRCHRSFLVNKTKISEVYLSQNRIVLRGEFEIPLSRSYKPAVKEYLKKGERQ